MKYNYLFTAALLASSAGAFGQVSVIKAANVPDVNPTNAEKFDPIPAVVKPANVMGQAPSDAIVLFDGKNLDQWVASKDKSAAAWTLGDGIFTVDKSKGDIETKKSFGSFQLHIEWKIPENITGTGQARG